MSGGCRSSPLKPNGRSSDGAGEISQQLRPFLIDVVTDQSTTGRVLRACHQKMIFSAFYYIKDRLQGRLPFKDKRGTWLCSIHFGENYVDVRHRKTQVRHACRIQLDGALMAAKMDKPQGYDAEGEFTFEWELQIRFGTDMNEISHIGVRSLVDDSILCFTR